MNNDYSVDFDKAGFCALCHVPIAEFDGFNASQVPIIKKILPNQRTRLFTLNTGSSLVVTLCDVCDSNLKPDQMGKLMESCIRGWDWVGKVAAPYDGHEKDMESHRQIYITNALDDSKKVIWNDDQVKDITLPRMSKMDIEVAEDAPVIEEAVTLKVLNVVDK